MLDKKQKSCVKRIHLGTGDGLYGPKAFHTVKTAFYSQNLMTEINAQDKQFGLNDLLKKSRLTKKT